MFDSLAKIFVICLVSCHISFRLSFPSLVCLALYDLTLSCLGQEYVGEPSCRAGLPLCVCFPCSSRLVLCLALFFCCSCLVLSVLPRLALPCRVLPCLASPCHILSGHFVAAKSLFFSVQVHKAAVVRDYTVNPRLGNRPHPRQTDSQAQ